MVNLTHEASLLQKIEDLAANRKIEDSVGLTAQEAKSSIEKLVQIIRQRFNAARFYFDAIQNMDSDFYLRIQNLSPRELRLEWSSASKSFVNFTDNDFHVQINLLDNDDPTVLFKNLALVVLIVLNGFFSNLVSLEDYIAEAIKIVYHLKPSDERPSYIRQALDDKWPNGNLIPHLRAFHTVDQDGKPDKTGSIFNITKEIRNKLMHDDIDGVVVSFSAISLSGSASAPKLHFHDSFFPPNTSPANTEMVAFCQSAYDGTVNFVDECYRLIRDDLQHSGALPV